MEHNQSRNTINQGTQSIKEHNQSRNTINISKNTLLIIKRGIFYNTYKDDAIILNFLLGYKISEELKVGFPENSLAKVINVLEEKKIDYRIIAKDKDKITKTYGNLNKYQKILKNAREFRTIYERAETIKEKLNDIDDIKRLEKIIGVIENEL